jgi:hypothetical protein
MDDQAGIPQESVAGGPEGTFAQEWTFATKSRCHFADCESLDTEQTSTQGQIQYRKCRRCGRTYKVLGWKV